PRARPRRQQALALAEGELIDVARHPRQPPILIRAGTLDPRIVLIAVGRNALVVIEQFTGEIYVVRPGERTEQRKASREAALGLGRERIVVGARGVLAQVDRVEIGPQPSAIG